MKKKILAKIKYKRTAPGEQQRNICRSSEKNSITFYCTSTPILTRRTAKKHEIAHAFTTILIKINLIWLFFIWKWQDYCYYCWTYYRHCNFVSLDVVLFCDVVIVLGSESSSLVVAWFIFSCRRPPQHATTPANASKISQRAMRERTLFIVLSFYFSLNFLFFAVLLSIIAAGCLFAMVWVLDCSFTLHATDFTFYRCFVWRGPIASSCGI